MSRLCSVCGRENPDGAAFCGYCGSPMASQPPQVERPLNNSREIEGKP
ncbi:zinc-ribbon domain-containing protein [Sulfodiicoccus acidiphilus]